MKFVRILSTSWLCSEPITSGDNQSFGPVTIEGFFLAVKQLKNGIVETEAAKWMDASGFFKSYPFELGEIIKTPEGFAAVLADYNSRAADFLAECPNFYLWLHPNPATS